MQAVGQQPWLSIIIPMKNAAETIERCLDSILCQDVSKVELILINDGSDDATADILCGYERAYANIEVIHNESNRGVSNSRNSGLLRSTGEYVWFVDADDAIEDNALTCLKGLIEKYSPDLVCFGVTELGDGGKVLGIIAPRTEGILRGTILPLYQGIPLYATNHLVRGVIARKIAFSPDLRICEDLLYLFEVYKNASSGVYLKSSLYSYYRLSTSATAKVEYADMRKALDVNRRILAYEGQHGHINAACEAYLERCLETMIVSVKDPEASFEDFSEIRGMTLRHIKKYKVKLNGARDTLLTVLKMMPAWCGYGVLRLLVRARKG